MSLFNFLFETKEDKFWKWFSSKAEDIAKAEQQNDPVIEQMVIELRKVNPDLVYEMSGVKNQKVIDFTVSADGKYELIPVVQKLVSKKPDLENWNITAFRQRNNTIYNFEMNDIKITGNGVKYLFVKDKDPNKISILLFFPNFSEEKRNDFGGAAYIFMDGIVGEYDVMTKIGFIDVFGFDSKYMINAKPLDELVKEFDEYFK